MLEFILTIFYFILFCLIISKLKFFDDNQIPKYWFVVIFGVKIIVSIILTSIYTNYYTNRETADIFKYFDDSKIMFEALKNSPIDYFKMLFGLGNDNNYFNTTYYNNMIHWYRHYNSNLFSDSHTIIRFNAIVRIFSFGYFQVHNVFINFISVIGLTAIYKAFKPFFIQNNKLLFYLIFLIPSVLFWGSGLLKEGLLFFALGLFIFHFFKIINDFNLKYLFIILLMLIIIFYTKIYIIAALIPSVLGYILHEKFHIKKALLSYTISILAVIIIGLSLSALKSKYDPFTMLVNKQAEFFQLINRTDIKINSIAPILTINNPIDVFKTIPNALFNTTFKPFIWEVNSPFILLNALENIFLILLIIAAIINKNKLIPYKNEFYFCLIFVITLFTIIGLTTPVIGAIVRYKIPALPFLLIALLFLIDINRIKNKSSFLNKFL